MAVGETPAPADQPRADAVVLPASAVSGDLARLLDELSALVTDRCEVVLDAALVVAPDIAVVEVLARLALAARRAGRGVRVVRAGPGLSELLALTGLAEIVGACEPSVLEVGREPEPREQRRVEEVMDVADPPTGDLDDLQ